MFKRFGVCIALIICLTSNAYAQGNIFYENYTDMVLSGMEVLLDEKSDNYKNTILYAKQLGLITEEMYQGCKRNKPVTKANAAIFLRNLISAGNDEYISSPYEDVSSLAVNYLYYNFIIDNQEENFNPDYKISRLTWTHWLKNAVQYTNNKLLFVANQNNLYPNAEYNFINYGFINIEPTGIVNQDIYKLFFDAFSLNASGISFKIEQSKEELTYIDFKSQLSDTWLYFNRTHGELTSGSKIEVEIIYDKTTQVKINFIRPNNYTDKRNNSIIFVSNKINEMNISAMPSNEQIDAVFNWIINNVSYSTELTNNSKYAYGAIEDGFAVCTGYTDLFSIFMSELNIDNIRIQGYYKDTLHAWNMIKLDNQYYFIDTTLSDGNVPPILMTNIDDMNNYSFNFDLAKSLI